MIIVVCPECEHDLDFLDTIEHKPSWEVVYNLWICHNDECEYVNTIYNDLNGELQESDPLGFY